jgi:hypothetical protein
MLFHSLVLEVYLAQVIIAFIPSLLARSSYARELSFSYLAIIVYVTLIIGIGCLRKQSVLPILVV